MVLLSCAKHAQITNFGVFWGLCLAGSIRESLLGLGCSLQWVYGGLPQFTNQFFPHKSFEGMHAGSYVSQRLEDWNVVGLILATLQVELLQRVPWERG